MTSPRTLPCLRGDPWPLGATCATWQGQTGVNLAVFSRHATGIDWCLFDEVTGEETFRVALPHCTDNVWHGFVPGLEAGQLYGLRATGPYQPGAGHRFNPAKLLIDPYARELVGDTGRLSLETSRTLDASGVEHPDPDQSPRHAGSSARTAGCQAST